MMIMMMMMMMMMMNLQVRTVDVCAAQNGVNICVNSISSSAVVPRVSRTLTMNSTLRSAPHVIAADQQELTSSQWSWYCLNKKCYMHLTAYHLCYVDAAYCFRWSSVVCQSVAIMSPAKMAKPIDMSFGMLSGVGPMKHV